MYSSDFRCYRIFFLWCFIITSYYFSDFTFAADRITRGHSIRDGDIIVSAGEKFALGFFRPQDSSFRYLGLWYYRIANESVVWVANRENPISDNNGVLTIGDDGNLIVLNGDGVIQWSSNVTLNSNNSTVILEDTGNLALFDSENMNRVIWQSFDHPTDTYLPDMRVEMNVQDGERRVLTSWKSANDPSPGNYSLGINPRGSSQIVIWAGQNRRWRSGYYNGITFTGVQTRVNYLFGFKINKDGDGRLSFTYTPSNRSNLVKFRVNWDGTERQERWINGDNNWDLIQSHPVTECDMYNRCGAFGKCNETDFPKCGCIEGFVAKDGGCVRRRKLQCEDNNSLSQEEGTKKDRFVRVERVKLPDFVDYVGLDNSQECENLCLENCSCTAYAYINGLNCMIWNQDLVDIQQFMEGGDTLFVRVAHSELGDKNDVKKIVVITVVVVGTFFVCVLIWFLCKRKTKRQSKVLNRDEMSKVGPSGEFPTDFSEISELGVEGQPSTGNELTMFNFNYVALATDNFSDKNKLGQGGFGHVYKGILPGGQEIAVKRLSRRSNQGLEEFKNEVMLIAKLQHRNLVRLLGCCIQGEEKVLLYEYMPNKSLDSYLFDGDKKAQLDWTKRFSIIEGIARGLLYLHRDSRLRIIHRDLKASNILLDEEMNPKISDFGMARIFGGNQNEANTNRVVGTYGYMAPEYAMEGLFSVKSDVYSFGVLLLEIITGKRNTSFRSSDYSNIIGYAWDLWDRNRAIELVDSLMLKSGFEEQVTRCIHVGMLCVQDNAANRPNMANVVLMLESENASLPMPKQPTFTSMRRNIDGDMWNENQDVSSNNVTISVIVGR